MSRGAEGASCFPTGVIGAYPNSAYSNEMCFANPDFPVFSCISGIARGVWMYSPLRPYDCILQYRIGEVPHMQAVKYNAELV